LRWRISTRRDLVGQSAAGSPLLTLGAGALVVASGLLPAAFSLASGALAGAVPPAVGRGMGLAAGSRVVAALAVASVVYVLIQVVGPLRASVCDILMRRVDESLAIELMRAVSGPRSIAHLENPAVLDRVAQAQGAVTGATAGASITYLGGAWALRLQGLAALAILLRFRWWLPLVLGAGQAVSFTWRRRHWRDMTKVVFDRTDGLRQADYLRRLALRPDAAKESQVFALGDWLVDRYRASFLATMRPVWRERRSGGPLALAVTLLLLALEGGALLLVVRAGTEATIGLGAAVVRPGGVGRRGAGPLRHGPPAPRGRPAVTRGAAGAGACGP